jgi:hypothetical protein
MLKRAWRELFTLVLLHLSRMIPIESSRASIGADEKSSGFLEYPTATIAGLILSKRQTLSDRRSAGGIGIILLTAVRSLAGDRSSPSLMP